MNVIASIANKKIYKGLDFKDKAIYEFNEIAGISESGWTEEEYQNSWEEEKSFDERCKEVITKLKAHNSAWPFMQPVNREEVPDYYEVIKRPIDIGTIEKRFENNYYKNMETFEDDVMRIFSNSKQYNGKDSIYWHLANNLQEFVTPFLGKMKEVIKGGE